MWSEIDNAFVWLTGLKKLSQSFVDMEIVGKEEKKVKG